MFAVKYICQNSHAHTNVTPSGESALVELRDEKAEKKKIQKKKRPLGRNIA